MKDAKKEKLPMNAMEAYRAAERVYRVLYWGAPKKLTWTFLALIEIIQTTGQWPDANQLAEAACIDLQTVEKHLKKLDLMGFINTREQTVCFPITPLPQEILGSYQEIVGLVLEDHCPKLPLQTQVPLYGLTIKFMTSSTEDTVLQLDTLEQKNLIKLVWQENQEVRIHLLPSAELAAWIGRDRFISIRDGKFKSKKTFNFSLAHAVANLA